MKRLEVLSKQITAPVTTAFRKLQQTMASGPGFTVAVLGAAGGIGQPLSLLLKINPLVKELRLYDVVNTPGVAADLSHINTRTRLTAHMGDAELAAALTGCDLVVIPAGVPRKPGMTRDDLFNINAGIVRTLCNGIAANCPNAWVCIISNPVNSTVPIAAEVFKAAGTYDPKKLFGVTTLDVVRANTFVAEILGVDASTVNVPVIGGHAGITILPLLSQSQPPLTGQSDDQLAALTNRIQNAGTEVVEAKKGAGSATLSMAYAAERFADACMRAMTGEPNIVECAYVASTLTDAPFFASPLKLGKSGIEDFLPIGSLSAAEEQGLEGMKAELHQSIEKGVAFVKSS